MLNIQQTVEQERAFFSLEGRLDTLSAPELERALQQVFSRVKELTLDFEKLEYISSAGLRVLLSAHKAIGGQGSVRLLHVNEQIQEIFDITGFSDILTIE